MNNRLNCRSPNYVTSHLRTIVEYLGLNEREAVQLKYRKPQEFEPELNNCHFNCWVAWNYRGGSIQHGWILSQDISNNFSEAIFHSVYMTDDGVLEDVTPRKDGEKRLLFIPDYVRKIILTEHNGVPAINSYDNVRLNGAAFQTQLSELVIIFKSDFARKHGLL